jgi:hypothetical protein
MIITVFVPLKILSCITIQIVYIKKTFQVLEEI